MHDYFWTWRKDAWPRHIYHAQITTAADYMDDLPEGTFVLFYSGRASLDLEVFQFLAPDVDGANRSSEFSSFGRSVVWIARSSAAKSVTQSHLRQNRSWQPPR